MYLLMALVERILVYIIIAVGSLNALWALLFPRTLQKAILGVLLSLPPCGKAAHPFRTFVTAPYIIWVFRLVGLFGVCLFFALFRSVN
jgi:hypothetical protein